MYGLIIAGGESSRMGSNKALLDYYGMPQYQYVGRLLEPYCKKVFLSANADWGGAYEMLPDHEQYRNAGPIAALLSAFERSPKQPFFVCAIDYPLIDQHDLNTLHKAHKAYHDATVFYNPTSTFFEAYIGIYEPRIFKHLKHFYELQQFSMQYILQQCNSFKVIPNQVKHLQNVNTPQDYTELKQMIHEQGH